MSNAYAKPRGLPLALPNLLTYGRIAATPLLAACLFFLDGDFARWVAVGLYAAACITDYFDGYAARVLEQQSALGRMLDPIADKLLVAVALLMLVHEATIAGWSIWAALVILSREILVSGLREYLAELNIKVHVSWLAKWKTGVQMVAIGVLLAGPAADAILPAWSGVGIALLWIAAALTLVTGFDYLRAAVKHALDE